MAIPQKFVTSLNGTAYQFTLHWCGPAACWILDIADQSGTAIVNGIPLVTGLPLLTQLRYLGILGELFVQSDNNAYEVPDYDSLGSTGNLFFIPYAAS